MMLVLQKLKLVFGFKIVFYTCKNQPFQTQINVFKLNNCFMCVFLYNFVNSDKYSENKFTIHHSESEKNLQI